MYLYPYKNGSKSCTDLGVASGALRLKREGSRFKGAPNKLVINWGSSTVSKEVLNSTVINPPGGVAICSNKLDFFNLVCNSNDAQGELAVRIPWYTDNLAVATEMLNQGLDYSIVCRTVLNGHGGDGIVLANSVDELVEAPLYTLYIKKKSEFRVHVWFGKVVDVQRKARNREIPDDQVNWKIRNKQFGFVFVRNQDLGDVPACVLQQAVSACGVVGLDFGAVDVIFSEKNKFATVLEVNTAPGLSGETLEGYSSRLKELNEYFKSLGNVTPLEAKKKIWEHFG